MRRTVGPLPVRVLLTCASSSRTWAHPARSARPRAISLIPADLFCPALDLVTFLILLFAMSKVGPDEPASVANSWRWASAAPAAVGAGGAGCPGLVKTRAGERRVRVSALAP